MGFKINFEGAKELANKLQEKGTAAGQQLGETAQNFGSKASDATKVAQDNLQEGLKAMKLKQLNPVFEEDYRNSDFRMPKLIHIVDYDKKHDDPLCSGSLGWIDTVKGVDVLNVYHSQLENLGFDFMPYVSSEELYYANAMQMNSFVNLSNYFAEMQQEKFAELERVAYKLGARRYSIQVEEEALELHTGESKRTMSLKLLGKKADASENNSYKEKRWNKIGTAVSSIFEEPTEPTVPELVWFRNDSSLKNLIEMRCSGLKLTKRVLEFNCASTSTISKDMAGKLDATIKAMGASGNFSISSQVEQEMRKRLLFEIEF